MSKKKLNDISETKKVVYKNFPRGIKDDTNFNYKLYQDMVAEYPHIKDIMEGLGISLEYQIRDIGVYIGSCIVFYIGSCFTMTNTSREFYQLMSDYRVSIQAPGNQHYLASVNIDIDKISRNE